MVFFRRPVIGFRGLGLVLKAAEKYPPAIDVDFCLPSFFAAVVTDALVLRNIRPIVEFGAIPCVLGRSRRSQICLPILQTIAIYMVHQHTVRDFEYLPMHSKRTSFPVLVPNRSGSVKSIAVAPSVPSVFGQIRVIVAVHDGIFVLGQRYPPKGIAVTDPPINKNHPNERCKKPIWYVKSDPNNSLSGATADWQTLSGDWHQRRLNSECCLLVFPSTF